MNLQPVMVPIPQAGPPRSPQQVTRQRRFARLALRHCAKLVGAPVDGWEKGVDGVPLCHAGFYWSVSHKRKWAAAVIADQPVGIDIEHIAPRRLMLHDALADQSEWALIGDRSWHSFFRLWTAKEAALKANGVGIGEFSACRLVQVPDECHMTLEYQGRSWPIEHYHHAEHVVAVTCDAVTVDWCVLDELQDIEKSKSQEVKTTE